MRYALRRPSRLAVDAAVVLAVGAALAALAHAAPVAAALEGAGARQIFTLAAAVLGAGAAILAEVAGRLAGDVRPSWLAAALALYCLVVLPTSSIVVGSDSLAMRTARVAAYLVVAALLVAAVRPPRALGAWGGWAAATVGAVVVLVLLQVPEPALAGLAPVADTLLPVCVLVSWTVAALSTMVIGHRRRIGPVWRIGLGFLVLAVAQAWRVAGDTDATSGSIAAFSVLRVFALGVVLVGFGRLAALVLARVRSEHFAAQEELMAAADHVERAAELAAERDHELRNGLAGLAGVTHLLSTDDADPDEARLRHAVLAELSRLHAILDGQASGDEPLPAQDYEVAPVVDGLATLRRSAGRALDVDVPDGVVARGSAAVLAQVVTNLLANCDRHAPGARVQVRARAAGGRVRVQVRDDGPGLPVGSAERLLDRGHRDEAAGGSGLGLHISRELLEGEGGTIELRSVTGPPGCLVTVALPAGSPEGIQRTEQAMLRREA